MLACRVDTALRPGCSTWDPAPSYSLIEEQKMASRQELLHPRGTQAGSSRILSSP